MKKSLAVVLAVMISLILAIPGYTETATATNSAITATPSAVTPAALNADKSGIATVKTTYNIQFDLPAGMTESKGMPGYYMLKLPAKKGIPIPFSISMELLSSTEIKDKKFKSLKEFETYAMDAAHTPANFETKANNTYKSEVAKGSVTGKVRIGTVADGGSGWLERHDVVTMQLSKGGYLAIMTYSNSFNSSDTKHYAGEPDKVIASVLKSLKYIKK